jgi:signal transduction histidine kinase
VAPADDAPDGYVPDSLDQLRHDLKSPLTTIGGRSQLLARAIQRSSTVNDGEREKLLVGLAAIDVAVQRIVVVVDGMNR